MKFRIIKFLKLPTPVELGMSKMNALGSRELTPFQNGPMWEDYYERIKKEYPIKYFFYETIPNFWRRKILRYTWDVADKAFYWLKCHILRDYKFHLIDLRDVDPTRKGYTHGYMDPGDALELACWAMLRRYVEKCKPVDPAIWADPEEIVPGGHLFQQKQTYDEIMVLYNWWMKGRLEDLKRKDDLFDQMKKASDQRDKETYSRISGQLLDCNKWIEEQEEKQILKLVKLRNQLWD